MPAAPDAEVAPRVEDSDLVEHYSVHYLRLVRLAAQLVDDQESAEDVVQDVFARLHAMTTQPQPRQMLAYLRRAVVNESRTAVRRRQVRRRWTPWHVVESAPAADEETLRGERASGVLSAVDRLPRRQREVVVLKYYEDLTTAQIAETLSITATAVTSSLARALTTLKTALGGDDEH